MLKESTIKTCHTCGKRFIPTVQWAYRIADKIYCSYGCYRKAGGDNGKWKMSTK